jgi:GNAT superfamily N-acetyltransferase
MTTVMIHTDQYMTDVIDRQAGLGSTGQLRFRRLVRGDVDPVLGMLSRCSELTLYRRFHGFTDARSYVRQLLARTDHVTLGAWAGPGCVGVGTLAGTDDHDLGVLIEDAWQRSGIGTALTVRLASLAQTQGIRELTADVLAETRFVLPVLARIGRLETTLAWGVYSIRVALGDQEPSQPGEAC